MKKRILLLLPVLLAAAVSVPRLAADGGAPGVTISNVADCVNDTCVNKTRIGAEVSYGVTATLATQYIGVNQQGAPILEDPITFAISKSQPVWAYALRSVPLVPSSSTGLSFQAYTIDPPRQSYAVTVSATPQGGTPYSFALSTDAPIYLKSASPHPLLVKLEGAETSDAAPPDFSSYVLFDWQDKVLAHHFLLVPRTMAPATTNANVASAIASLLQSLFNQDKVLLTGGKNTTYLVDGMKIFRGAPLPGSGNLTLAVMNPAVAYSTVTLEMDNAQVSTQVNEAQAYITGAYVLKFTAMAQTGTMVVDLENAGNTPTTYIVTINHCEPNIVVPVPTQAQTMNPGDSKSLYFDIATNVNAGVSHSCMVTLTGQTGRIFDSVTVYFDTMASSY